MTVVSPGTIDDAGEVPPQEFDQYDDREPVAWTTVATFYNIEAAHMASLRLDEQDIPVYISGEYMTATAWHYSIAVGGAKVQVPLKFVERAMQILDLPSKIPVAQLLDRSARCPRCGSENVRSARTGRRIAAAVLLVAMCMPSLIAGLFAATIGAWVLWTTRYRTCEECGYIWRGDTRGFEVIAPAPSPDRHDDPNQNQLDQHP